MKQYPTEEELNRFLEELKKEELYAPAHLKEEIMNRVFPEEMQEEAEENGKEKDPEENQSRVRKQEKSTEKKAASFAVYVLKVAAGMAAALTLLIVNPFRDGSDISRAGLLQEEDRPGITREDLNDPEYRAEKAETFFDRLNNNMREAKEKIMENDL